MLNDLKKRSNLVLGLLTSLEKELFVANKGRQSVIVSEAYMVIKMQADRIEELEQALMEVDRPED